MYLCQSFSSHIVKTVCQPNAFFTDSSGSKVFDKQNTHKAFAYVDNYMVVGTSPSKVNALIDATSKHIIDLGLQVHRQSKARRDGEFIGMEFHSSIFIIKRKRIWRLKFALSHITRLPKCSGELLQIVVGHITWCMLIRRESLASLNHTYRFINEHLDHSAVLPLSVRCELNNIKSLLPFFSGQL